MITTRPQTAPITTIPQEVAEAIVLALADSPLSVSAVAKTCLWFNTLIYQATDDHLWRELFLALYDDPRDPRSVGIPTAITSSFCWRTAYQQRAWVSRRLQALNEGSKSKQPSPTAPFLTHDHSFAIILSIFDTALPIRSTILPGISPVPHYFRDAQPLHPLIVAHQETPMLPSADKLTHCTQSKNIQELSKISLRGFQRLLEEYDLVDRRSVLEWRSVQRVQDACKYITTCGWPSSLRRRPAGPVNEEERLIPRFLPLFTSAHKKVFNMNYLTLQGTRGPFIPLNTSRTTDLKPDWIHLAAVRLITQEAITTYLSIDHHPLFGGGNYLRRGAWVPPYSCDGTTHDRYERDWAGVEGVWRRMALWLPFSRLMHYNSGKSGTSMESDRREFAPLLFKIIGYDNENVVKDQYPTIKLEGYMGGEEWNENAVGNGYVHDIRAIEGSVSMLSDGNIRWSMLSYHDNEIVHNEAQWLFEGVQIGGAGSMAGVLGTWTSADISRNAPIGPWWQWRVA